MAISTGPADKMTIGVFRMIYDTVLGEKLSDEDYNLVKEGKTKHGEIAYMNGDVAVGIICANVQGNKLIVTKVAVLEAYRNMGVEAELLKSLEKVPKLYQIEAQIQKDNEALISIVKELEYTEKSAEDAIVVYVRKVPKQNQK